MPEDVKELFDGDAKKFVNMTEMSWIPEMCLKYPKNAFEVTETIAGATDESSFSIFGASLSSYNRVWGKGTSANTSVSKL